AGLGQKRLRSSWIIGQRLEVRIIAKGQLTLEGGDFRRLPGQYGLDDGGAVDGHGQRLAHLRIGGNAVTGVEAQRIDGRAGNGDDLQLRVGLDHRQHADRNGWRHDDVDAAGLEFGDGGRGLGDETIVQFGNLRRATPVIGISLQLDAGLRRVGYELERTGADRVEVEIVLALLLDVFG